MALITATELFLTIGDNKQLRRWIVGTRDPTTGVFTPADLTSATGVELHCASLPTPTLACTWAADTTGTVTRIFLTADIGTTEGVFPFETQVTWGDGTITTFPKPGSDLLHVQAQLG